MMRGYIFRGKRVGTDEWVEGCLIYQNGYYLILQDESKLHPMDVPYIDEFGYIDGRADPVIPESVGQYTGMNDKNGRKIFEGDICRIKIPHEDQSLDEHELAKVIFEDGYFEIVTRYGDIFHHYWLTLEYVEKPEVVGNVYDNADLLEE